MGPGAGERIGPLVRSLVHRGPDGHGRAGGGRAWIGSTRLSIVDPPAPCGPLGDPAGRLSLAFNGEIYNHRALRAELTARGHRFRTGTDGEVILHLYEELGPECVHRLRGMFAFAVLDPERLFLARDRLGIKPLHYHAGPTGFLFSSEVTPLLAAVPEAPRLDMQAFADAVVLNHPVGEHTWFEGIRSLPPGHHMTVPLAAADRPVVRRYVGDGPGRDPAMPFEEAVRLVEDRMTDAITTHLDADVEVGMTLSGGIDSALLALFAGELAGRPLRTFTVADHPDHPDLVQAETVAKLVGSEHHGVVIGLPDLLDAVPRQVRAEAGPSSLFGTPLLILCERIRAAVPACLHGEGADELFGGYPEYLDRYTRAAHVVERLPLLGRLGIAPSDAAARTIRAMAAGPSADEYIESTFRVNMADPLQRMHLDPVDRSSMSVGLEMRVPYLDDELVDLARRIPVPHLVRADIGVRKYLLRRLALERFGPVHGSPIIDLVLREKLGAPSAGTVVLREFDRLCRQILPDDYRERHEFGFCFPDDRRLLLFDYFRAAFLDHRGDVDAVGGIVEFAHDTARRQR